eukprot:CAMPEP_0185774872 /NCGR_PEP_ID=MMETSP1174-20130828/80283_1 /TAXON_ID=35687 /ORGANISM="Dictyocha speculum, Strain CCMP1381" /LENGTH=107 /DNA_ID=CAMNT_0028462257 /DNA_START=306 /DNA_END=625 /DNA_ORIENTATION=-
MADSEAVGLGNTSDVVPSVDEAAGGIQREPPRVDRRPSYPPRVIRGLDSEGKQAIFLKGERRRHHDATQIAHVAQHIRGHQQVHGASLNLVPQEGLSVGAHEGVVPG